MLDDKYIGLALAISSSFLIGISFIITKKGLLDCSFERGGQGSEDFSYLRNMTWWAGMITMAFGEVANFAAYSFAPAILVTPLGALSVIISAVLASWLLNEKLGTVGKAGCTLCIIGAVEVVLHAPEDKPVHSVDDILTYALQPGFLAYCIFVLVFSLYMIFKVVPTSGKRSPVVYISICSLVGSVSVMAVKGFGIALKLTVSGGGNQLTHPSTYLFALIVVVSILTQMNYFNKALDQFSTNIVTPIYYVMFTTATIVASVILFHGMNDSGARDTISLLCGFFTIFIGVFLLNNTQRAERRSSTVLTRLSSSIPAPVANRKRRNTLLVRSGRSSLSGYARLDMNGVEDLDEDTTTATSTNTTQNSLSDDFAAARMPLRNSSDSGFSTGRQLEQSG